MVELGVNVQTDSTDFRLSKRTMFLQMMPKVQLPIEQHMSCEPTKAFFTHFHTSPFPVLTSKCDSSKKPGWPSWFSWAVLFLTKVAHEVLSVTFSPSSSHRPTVLGRHKRERPSTMRLPPLPSSAATTAGANLGSHLIHFPRLSRSSMMLLFAIFMHLIAHHAVSAKKKLKEQDIIQRVLKDYDWRVRPRGNNDSWPGECLVLGGRRAPGHVGAACRTDAQPLAYV